LRYADGQLRLYPDGPEVLSFAQPAYPATLGLATRDAAVMFTGIWQTGIAEEQAKVER